MPDSSTRDGSSALPKGFQGAKRWLNQLVDFEKTRLRRFSAVEMKLERMQKLMQALGNPQDSVRCIHVAGTNGKGSVSHMIDNMMRGIGYTVGRYTSPHLIDVRERISVGGIEIDKAAFGDVITKVAEAAQSIDFEPTFFEAITAAAFVHFEAEAVDLAVIEVGLGGRLDCTNIIQPVLTIITKLDIDHAPILGDTLAKIAAEKAGIMKSGAPCFTLQQEPEALEVLEARAKEVGCDLYVLGREIEFSRRFGTEDDKGSHCRICVIRDDRQYMHIPAPAPGEHQAINTGLAIAVVDELRQGEFKGEEQGMLENLAQTDFPGRMELIHPAPRIIGDGAHNPSAVGAFIRSIGGHIPFDSMVCVIGCCEDKDIDGILTEASRGGDKFFFTKAKSNPRAADPRDLQRRFQEVSGKMSQVADDLPTALLEASKAVGRDDIICVIGSYYLAGEAKQWLADRRAAKEAAATPS